MKKNIGTSIALLMLFLSSTIGLVEGAVNLISNPGYESGTTSWNFYASGGGTFTTLSPGFEGNKSAQLALSNGGTNIQLYQTPVTLEANTRYRLSFAAYSNTGHDMTVRFQKHTSPYTPYMPEFTVNLGTSWQTFSNEFNSTGFSGTVNDGRLMFWLPSYAAAGDKYYIDDVRLEKIPQGPIQINSCTGISSPGEYVLTQNILNSNVANCITITSSDVILDGAGFTIDGNGLTNYGLSINNVNRITVKNLIFQDWNTRAVNIVNSNNNNFSNITVRSGNNDGFYLQNSNNNKLRNITALNTGHVGFTFDSSQGNDLNGAILQNNAWEDFDIYITGGISSCNNAAKNVSLTNNYKLHYYNETVNLNNIIAGAIYLCNADNSVITNVEVISINEQNSISNYYVENVTYTNIITSGLREAIFFKYSANNTITNILMKDGWNGISYSTNTTNTNFKNATIYNMTDRAIRMYAGASRNIISDSKIFNNSVGIYLNTAGKYGPNRIYNSLFNNTQNIEWGISDFFGDGIVYPNYWNTTKQPGMNLMGGPSLGGNFWGYPNGTGFSQTCLDGNSDGICDLAYTLKSNNIDYLPLVYTPSAGPVHNINKGTNYASIQAAIDDANTGDEIHVDSGTYYENVNVTKRLILRGVGMPVVDAGGSGSAITLAADGIILEGFTAIGGGSYYEGGIRITSDNNTLIGNNASNNGNGIFLDSSSNNTLIGNNVNSNFGYNFEVGPRFGGISFYVSSNNTLIGNNVSNNYQYGISLYESSNNKIYNNIFNNIDNYYIRSSNVVWNITHQSGTNIVGYPYLGGNFWGSPNGTGFSQICKDIDLDGICDSEYRLDGNNFDYLPLAYNSTIGPIHNINKGKNYTNIQAAINDASRGDEIHVDSGTYYENVNINKQLTLRGIGMPVVDAGRSGSAITLAADGIILEGFTATNASSGILVNSNNNTLIGNNASNNHERYTNGFGIYLDFSSNNMLIGNNASNNNGFCGICLSSSNNNTLIGNIANHNYVDMGYGQLFGSSVSLHNSNNNTLIGNNVSNNINGISLQYSSNNVLKENIMGGNEYNLDVEGGSPSDFDHQIETTNLVDGKPVYYINGAKDTVYDSYTNAGTFYCINCVNVTLKNLELKKNMYGIYFWNTTHSKIQNVNASNNAYGIGLIGSSNNTLIGNNANSNNGPKNSLFNDFAKGYGIILGGSNNNTLIGNNALNNSVIGYGAKGGGISLSYSSNNTLIGNNANSNFGGFQAEGISLFGSGNNTLIGNNANHNTPQKGVGISIESSSNNIIYNNIFNNTNNIAIDQYVDTSSINTWNITRQLGTNIIGGPNLGGNFWAHPDGTGFSQTCTDADVDGICDSAYVLDANNIDYLPLALPSSPSITIVSPKGGENWTRGSNQVIRWNYTGSPGPNVRIELLKNGVINRVINSSVPLGSNGSGSYNWLINSTQIPGADYKIKINSTNDSKYSDTSNGSFAISQALDTTKPTVIGITPIGINVPINTQITVTFSEAMNKASSQLAFSTFPSTIGNFGWSGENIMVYTPGSNLSAGTTYTATVRTDAKDVAGNSLLIPYNLSFTTALAPDTSSPIVIGSTPAGQNVSLSTQITITFNESMNQSSVQNAFSTSPATNGSLTWNGNMMIYTLGPALNAGAIYTITVGTGALDLAGNAPASAYSWQFTTISALTLEERVALLEIKVAALEAALAKLTNP